MFADSCEAKKPRLETTHRQKDNTRAKPIIAKPTKSKQIFNNFKASSVAWKLRLTNIGAQAHFIIIHLMKPIIVYTQIQIGHGYFIAKLRPSSSFSWAELALFSC